MVTALPIATIVVFAILSLPITYCCFKHGKSSLLGWGVIQSFCIVRIIGSIFQIRNETTGHDATAALVVVNIGLSPMILGTLGILHEARIDRDPSINARREWTKVMAYHSLIILATVLLVIGVINQIDTNDVHPTTIRKIGVILILVAVQVLAAWILSSFRKPQPRGLPTWYDATILLGSTALVVPFIILRTVYAVIVTFTTDAGFQNSLAAKVCMSVVPEMLLVAVLAVNGIRTRNIAAKRVTRDVGEEMLVGGQISRVQRSYGK